MSQEVINDVKKVENSSFTLLPCIRGKRFNVINLPKSKEEYINWIKQLLCCKNVNGVITGEIEFWNVQESIDNWIPDYEIQPVKAQSRKDRMNELYESIVNMQYVTFDGEPTDNCPMCQSLALPVEDQPQPGTHAYSIIYKCGSKVDSGYQSDEFNFYQSDECKGV